MKVFKVKIKTSDFYFISKNISVYNLTIMDSYVIFECEKEVYEYLKDNDIKYEIIKDRRISNLIRIYKGIICGVIIFFGIVFINSKRITKIEFNSNYVINNKIEEIIYDNSKKILGMNMIDNLDNLEKIIRNEFFSYPWISIKKEGTTILVDITSYDSDVIIEENNILGNLVAVNDGIISSIHTYQGISLYHMNEYVKKGDILIDSNNKYQAKGLVLANTFETYETMIKINDVLYEEIYNVEDFYSINLFKYNFKLKRKFKISNYNENIKTVFNFFNLFKIRKNSRTEIIKKEVTYTLEDARNQALKEYKENFMNNIVSDLEEIKSLEVLSVDKINNNYKVKILAFVNKNIAKFIPLE